ncbi:hypothetical protein G4B88_001467 [Cannabis sativa]|uniref:GRAM domain-containing protein n=1 Tax=Cannabis sativa TaxID=3483 RepID=A0A7J6FAP9_CANSA|nr:hypothetical protein G4B88_001467 [Cannabis sativa]
MNNNNNKTQVSYPTAEEINPFHQTNPFVSSPPPPPLITNHQNDTVPAETTNGSPKRQEKRVHFQGEEQQKGSSSSSSSVPPQQQQQPEEFVSDGSSSSSGEKWGTHVMGHPAVPTCHPSNKKAALWGGAPTDDEARRVHYPYLQYTPIEKAPNSTTPMDSMIHAFNSWSNKAESLANNIWHNHQRYTSLSGGNNHRGSNNYSAPDQSLAHGIKTGPSMSGAAWGKMNLTAKALTGGGYESLYKQSFSTFPNEKLKKTWACYLSTSTGPVAGTLYLSNVHVAFCSDRPLSFTAPSGQQTWSYYKVMVPLGNIGTINPVVMRENPSEKYMQVVTIDGHDFWFMGFVNYEKASKHLTESISTFVASGYTVPPVIANQK